MTLPYKILIVIGLLTVSFFYGRYTAKPPTFSETDQQQTRALEHTHTTIYTPQYLPSGLVVDMITNIDRTVKSTQNETKAITKQAAPTINLALLAGYNYRDPSGLTYGLAVSKQVAGPVTAGLFGFDNGTVGVSVGINF